MRTRSLLCTLRGSRALGRRARGRRGLGAGAALLPALAILVALGSVAARGDGDPAPVRGAARDRAGTLAATPGEPLATAGPALEAAAALAPLGPAFRDALFTDGRRSGRSLDRITQDSGARARAAVLRWSAQGSGLPLGTSPWIAAELKTLADEGGGRRSAADHIRRRLRLFARAANLGQLPDGLRPLYAETRDGGDGEVLDTRAFTAGFLAQVELAGELLRQTHRETVAGREEVFVGADPAGGFEGLVALYVASARLHAFGAALASDGRVIGSRVLADYDPFDAPGWLPADPKVEREGTEVTLSEATATSRLSDHARALLGAARFHALGRPGGSLAPIFRELTAGGARERVFGPEQIDLAKRTARFLYRNLVAFHFDPAPEHRTFVSTSRSGAVGRTVRIADLGLGLSAISAVDPLLKGEDTLVEESRLIAQTVGAFVGRLLGDYPSLPASVELAMGSPKLTPSEAEASAGDLADLAQGLLAAHRVSGDKKLERLLARVLDRLESQRFDPWVDLYLGSDPAAEVTLGPTDGPRLLSLLGRLGAADAGAGALIRLERLHGALVGLDALPSLDRGAVRAITVRVER